MQFGSITIKICNHIQLQDEIYIKNDSQLKLKLLKLYLYNRFLSK